MKPRIGRDTRLCISLAGRPGNFGTRFHNALYEELGLDYVYKAFTTTDLRAAIGGVRALGIRGCAVSMPFKEACIQFLDELDPSAAVIGSVNTIVNNDGYLRAYNTDYIAVSKLLEGVPTTSTFLLRGSGGMAKAVAYALRDAGFRSGTILARNEGAGRVLAEACGFAWHPSLDGIEADLLVNVTPIGMAGGPEADELAFPPETIARARTVFDVVALPPETPLIRYARQLGRRVITGAEVAVLQAVEQFVLYTGVRPGDEQIGRAAALARGP
ncbi:shikimate 5-dehydrogenase [Deinococcus sp. YIM 134068]|uniref:shikimate 5-dehydrogenase n=1 Tax=Deinococcus lichenicola TaxID=3118910 RepID=UPI002F95ECDD